jgi:hypothetical protein
MALDTNNTTTSGMPGAPTDAPTAAPVAAAPAPAPNLSGLAQPGPAAAPPTDAASVQAQLAGPLAAEQAAYKRAAEIAAQPIVNPKAPHAQLTQIISSIGIGLDSFGKALATHGREGGATEVAEYNAQQQQQKQSAQAAAAAQKNTAIAQQLAVADTNHKLGQNIMFLHTIPNEMTKSDLEVQKEKLGVVGQTQDIRTKALQDFVQTGDLAAYQDTLSKTGSAPATAGASAGAAPTGAASATPGAPAGAGAAPAAGAIPPVAVAQWKNSVDAAASAYPNDEGIKGAAAVIANPNSTPQQMAMAANGAKNRMAALDAGVKSRTEQEAASAGARPKDLNDAVGRLTQAQQAFAVSPTPANQTAVDNAKAARENFLSAAESEKRTAQAIQDGDPNLLAQGLVSGDVAWSQVVSSRKPEFATAAFKAADELSMAQTGQHFSAMRNEVNYKQATNPQVQSKLRMIEGMTEKGGSIDIATAAASKLPAFNEKTANKVFNVVSGELGNTAITNFHTAMLGLADEYSQVMGSGGGTDASRQQGLDILHDGYSKGQLAGSIAVMKADITARQKALTADNPTLQKAFPAVDSAATPATAKTPVLRTSAMPLGTTGIAPGPDGKMHYHNIAGHDLGIAPETPPQQ